MSGRFVKYYGKRKGLDSLSYNIVRRENRGDYVTKLKREDELRDERLSKIKNLNTRSHLFKGKDEQKIEEERAYTLPLECFGFHKRK